jgi:peptidyl-prolyl cis-trans isomerase A (cyclophilin A)
MRVFSSAQIAEEAPLPILFGEERERALALLSVAPGDISARMIRRRLLALLLCLAATPVVAAGPRRPAAPVRVRLDTSMGAIVIELDTRRAPITSVNFLRYVDAHYFDGTTFYRAARTDGAPKTGLVQGGVNHNMVHTFPPIKHEPTNVTGIRHVDGTVSMARNDPGTAMGDFFIVIGPGPYLDAAPDYPGYAAFGHVVSGMDVAKRMLALPTWPGGWSAETVGQSIRQPPKIISARRLP